MKRLATWGLAVTIAAGLAARPASAQAPTAPASDPQPEQRQADSAAAADGGVAKRFVRDVGSDYKNFFSVETGLWLGIGGGAALAMHAADDSIQQSATGPNAISLPGGSIYGSQLFQIPVAVALWGIASAAGSERHAEAGRDLLRAQISVASWTYLIKVVAQRKRPDGSNYSFPSGHASASFATAMVLQEHYGWKVGLPAFLAAGYTGASRITDNQHWASDVVFGAFLGMASGRVVTLQLRQARVTLAPLAVPKGGGVVVTVLSLP